MMKEGMMKYIIMGLMLLLLWGCESAPEKREINVGVVLDLSERVGKIGLSCINMSLSDFYEAHPHYNTRMLLNVRDSQNDVVTAASAAVELMKKEKVEAILGPVTSMQASFVVNLGDKSHVPIISFTATSPSLTSLGSSYFFRIAQNDSLQVDAIKDIIQSFGWRQAVPIYIDNDYGRAIIPFLTNSLQQANIRVPYLSVISPSATHYQIEEQLYKLMTMQTRVFVVHMLRNPGSDLFAIADRIGMMSEGYVWIVTNGMANTLASLDADEMQAMQGVIGVKTYVPRSKRMVDFQARWKRRFLKENPAMVDANLNVFGLWAYDATTALASAVERANNTTKSGFENATTNTSSNFSKIDNVGVSKSGEELRDALSDTRFSGLAGEFSLVNGQLDATTFQIINVNGNGEKVIGFWTPQKGLTRNLSSSSGLSNNNENNLGAMIWPGDSYSVPKGWEMPTNGNKLMIGVPVSSRPQFVKVEIDGETNTTKVTGFSIDVFEAVVQALPYALPYQLIPFAKPNGEMAGTYDDLIMQVYYGVFDAVVGDTTIIANRSKYVDFTLPYTESGVSMVVPVKDKSKKGAWVFLKPLTWDLWMTTGCSFVFFGFVVWVLEHRINKDFRGPPSHQIGTSLWFSFSTMVFAHREKVVSNTARFVVIIWVFVVLILTQSYTANLSSLLTVEQLRPTLTNVNDLIKYGTRVGYHRGSFIRAILLNLGFKDFQLVTYNTTAQCDDLLSRGSQNGGIAAAFDEIPYIRILLGTYCSKYAMVDPTFKTDGFGFVFPRNSPLVADVSRAILKVTEDPRMKEIENAWFQNQSSCQEDASVSSSNSLGLDSFWGLFLIAALASISALLIFSATFLYDHRHQWWFINNTNDDDDNNNNHLWKTRIRVLLRIFDEKDPRSHRFRRGSINDSIKEEDRENNQSSSTIIGPHYHHHQHDHDHSLGAASSFTDSSFSFQGSPCEDNNVELNNLNSSQPSQQEIKTDDDALN